MHSITANGKPNANYLLKIERLHSNGRTSWKLHGPYLPENKDYHFTRPAFQEFKGLLEKINFDERNIPAA